jgi:hypothetical protein
VIRLQQPDARVVDVGRLRRDSVQFDDREATALEVADRPRANVVASEVEAFERPRHVVECPFDLHCERGAAVEKQRATAMRAKFPQ